MDQLIAEMKKPLGKNPYAVSSLLTFLVLGLYPILKPDALQTLVLSGMAFMLHFYLVARRLSDLEKHFLFSLIIFIPVLGWIFGIYLCFVDKEDWEEHFSLLSEKLA